MRQSHTITLQIERPLDMVYAFLADPRSFPLWAAVDLASFRPLENGDWTAETAMGPRHFRFTALNDFGVVDHAMFMPGDVPVMNPMRVVANEGGSELSYTFFARDGMDDAQFTSTIEWITSDLWTLKSVVEAL